MKVEHKHLVGEIADFPLHVVQAMVDEQVRQGNPANPYVFAKCCFSTKADGGFDWVKTSGGDDFWSEIIEFKRFRLIPLPLPKKPNRKVIQISESMTSDDRYASPWNLTALCDDGSLWVISTCDGGWTRLPDIPQDGCDEHLTSHKTGCYGYVPRGSD